MRKSKPLPVLVVGGFALGLIGLLGGCGADEPLPAAMDAGSENSLDAFAPLADVGATDMGSCVGVVCGENAKCDPVKGSCRCSAGFYGDPSAGCETVAPLTGWIGSPCTAVSDCSFAGSTCTLAGEGYPGGHCSMDCTQYCPDQAGMPTTFCIQPLQKATGHCFAKCDHSLYPLTGGCRPEYRCTIWARIGESTMDSVCVPQDWVEEEACGDPLNLEGSDECFLELISFGDPALQTLSAKIIDGTSTSSEALEFLDSNFTQSQFFVQNDLGVATIQPNYHIGHDASQPMVGFVYHYTANQREDQTIKYFAGLSPHASSHFVIGSFRNGLPVQLFSHRHRTWHAGNAYNTDYFGIEIANAGYLQQELGGWVDYTGRPYTMYLPLFGRNPLHITDGIPGAEAKYADWHYWQPFTYYQVLSIVIVGRALNQVYQLSRSAFRRHGDISDNRVDPGPGLPTTYMTDLIFNREDLFKVPWLTAYKTSATWMADHPEAR